MKRLRLPLFCILMITVLLTAAACGDTGSPDDGPEPTPTPTETGSGTNNTPEPTESADEFDAEAHFRGQTVRLMTSSGPGGGTDLRMRYFASQWGKFIPGNPRLVASNISPHLAGNNYLYKADPDGFTIGMWSHNPTRHQHWEGSQYVAEDFRCAGEYVNVQNLVLMSGDLPYDNVHDMMGSDGPPLVYGELAPSPASLEASTLARMLEAEFLDLPLEIRLVAESGASAELLNLERGLTTAISRGAAWFSFPELREGWVADGTLVPYLDVTPFDGRALGNSEMSTEELRAQAPHLRDLLTQEQLDIYTGVVWGEQGLTSSLQMPPNTPDEIVNVFEQALIDALEDPDFRAGLERLGVVIDHMSGEECEAVVRRASELQAQYAGETERLAEELWDKYVK